MSATNTPSGPNSTTPNAGPTPVMRRPKPSAFAPKKKPVVKKPRPTGQTPQPPTHTNGAAPTSQNAPISESASAGPKDYDEYPILVTKAEMMQGLRHHVIKFLPKQDSNTKVNVEVNPFDESQFTRPVHLHRRLARDKAAMVEVEEPSGADDKEREILLAKKAEKEAEREAARAQIAPGGTEHKPVKRKNQKQIYSHYIDEENDPAKAKRAKLRHEEARQWHLEDFERKNTWVGSYEEPLSEQTAMFVVEGNGFRMVPVERWYKFIPTNKVQAMNLDTAERHMNRKTKLDRWMMKTQPGNTETKRMTSQVPGERRRRQNDDDDGANGYAKTEDTGYRGDADEIDFEWNDEFQDDDEGMIWGDDPDEAKETEQRLRQEQREANLPATGMKDEDRDWDLEEEMEKEAARQERKQAKKMRKALKKKEHKFEYDSDSDHPYSSSSDSEDSDEERERIERERKEKEEEARKLASGDKSGASTKGTNTPTGRSEKRSLNPNAALGASLKRPGSPNLSDASGNESSRKKARMNGVPSGGARSLSPDAARNAGSGSDTDTASRSGSAKPKIRLKNSPPGSRAGSPPPSGAASPRQKSMVTLEEIRAAIPATGCTTGDLIKMFKNRTPPVGDFIAMVKKVTKWDKEAKLMFPAT